MKRALFFILILIPFVLSCVRKAEDVDKDPTVDSFPEELYISDITDAANFMADSLLYLLTLEERIGECLMPSFYANSDDYTLKTIRHMITDYHIGGIVLMKGDKTSAAIIAEMGAQAKIPLFISIDAEWGLAMRLKDAPSFPRNGNIKNDADETLLFDYGREVAEECREIGINMVLGPVIDISGVYNNIIGKRSFGSNPQRVAELGVAYAKGVESGGVISVAKHFPGHGSSIIDSHYGVARVNKSISALDTLDFYPFRQFINSGLTGIMAGHIEVPSLTPTREPAAVSYEILSGLLREEMGFKGLILTDAFDMGGARGFSAGQALLAGADIVLCPSNVKGTVTEIKTKVENGEIDSALINDRCRRILFTKALFGLWYKGDSIYCPVKEFNSNASRIRKSLVSE